MEKHKTLEVKLDVLNRDIIEIGREEIESEIKRRMAHELSEHIIESGVLKVGNNLNMDEYSTRYTASLTVINTDEFKKIETFLNTNHWDCMHGGERKSLRDIIL